MNGLLIILIITFSIRIGQCCFTQHVIGVAEAFFFQQLRIFQGFINGFTRNKLLAHHAHGNIDSLTDNPAATACQKTGQQARQAFLLRGFHQLAGQHQSPGCRIHKHQLALAQMFFPVALIDFVSDQQVTCGFVRNPQQGFCQTHQGNAFLRR